MVSFPQIMVGFLPLSQWNYYSIVLLLCNFMVSVDCQEDILYDMYKFQLYSMIWYNIARKF